MQDIFIKAWDWLRAIPGAVVARWAVAAFVVFFWATPYITVAAENAVVQILEKKGFTVEDFKDVQQGLEHINSDIGAVKGAINNINNTLTERSTTFNELKGDVGEVKGDINRLVDYIINKKTNREDHPQ